MAGFEGAAFGETEYIHAEFFEVFGEDKLAWWVRARNCFAIASEDVD